MEEIFIGVMDLQEAKNHQHKLKARKVELTLKTHHETCATGCKVTVEVWGQDTDKEILFQHFQSDYLKHVKGHEPRFELLSEVFDPSRPVVTCQACGVKFEPSKAECPDCGLCY